MPGAEDLSLGKVARLCQVSRSTVYRWVVGGQLQAYPLPSGHFRVKPVDVSRFCQANGVPDPLQSVDLQTLESHQDLDATAVPAGLSVGVTADRPVEAGVASSAPVVLVVDDQPAIRLVMCRLLQRLLPGVRLVEASNGIEACIRIGAERPNLLLLDIMMPGMDGFGVVQEILQQKELHDIEVVIISAYEPFDRLQQLRAQHPQVVGVHRKPIDLMQLKDLLGTTAVGRSLLHI